MSMKPFTEQELANELYGLCTRITLGMPDTGLSFKDRHVLTRLVNEVECMVQHATERLEDAPVEAPLHEDKSELTYDELALLAEVLRDKISSLESRAEDCTGHMRLLAMEVELVLKTWRLVLTKICRMQSKAR